MAETMSRLRELLSQPKFWVEMVLANGQTLLCLGTGNTLTVRTFEGEAMQAYCLSKRRQTPHHLEVAGKSVSIPHHQILQREDAELIISSLLKKISVPDAYHLEPIVS